MVTVAYGSPFVPVEWLAAHGLQPLWLRPSSSRCVHGTKAAQGERRELRELAALVSGRRGLCPLAAAVADAVCSTADSAAVVLTTSCDQMRYVASLLEYQHGLSVFVMNVPSTWQTEASRSLYLAELQRLGRFLVALGGNSPSPAELSRVMEQFDRARVELRQARSHLSAKTFAAALISVREGLADSGWRTGSGGMTFTAELGLFNGKPKATASGSWLPLPRSRLRLAVRRREDNRRRVQHTSKPDSPRWVPSGGWDAQEQLPLALAGGPLPESDYELFDWVQQAGGRIALDATEWGERTLPRPFDVERTQCDPLEELADAYFGAIPDVFRRPHGALYEYLGRELSSRRIRGLIVRRYLWCDLWHAELAQLKAWSPVPVLDLDAADNEDSSEGRTRGRIEAFLEMLR